MNDSIPPSAGHVAGEADCRPPALNYCSHCGHKLSRDIPPGDDRPRYICKACGRVHYQNPKLVVGTIPEYGDRILFCRRAIEPCAGLWTLPAGFLENGESVAMGALRETREETGAEVEIVGPYALFNICHVGQIYLMFRACMRTSEFSPGPESSDVQLLSEADIPWEKLAFSVIEATLKRYVADRRSGDFAFAIGDIGPVRTGLARL